MDKIASVVSTGNSLAVVIPAVFVKKLGLRTKDKVKIELNYQEGSITYTFLNVRQLPLV